VPQDGPPTRGEHTSDVGEQRGRVQQTFQRVVGQDDVDAAVLERQRLREVVAQRPGLGQSRGQRRERVRGQVDRGQPAPGRATRYLDEGAPLPRDEVDDLVGRAAEYQISQSLVHILDIDPRARGLACHLVLADSLH